MKTNKPTAFITGINGQDGAYLADLLLKKGYKVYGGFRRGGESKLWRLDFLGITKQVKLVEFHLNETQQVMDTFNTIKPDEIYNLAGDSFVTDSFKHPVQTMEVNVIGVLNILNAVKLICPNSKLFFASSSEIFGYSDENGLNENSNKIPNNPYGISRLTATNFVRLYREKYNMFACSGILFNHEGPLRSKNFITRKITYNLAKLKYDSEQKSLEVGNFNSARDWGNAEDYVNAMYAMLQNKIPRDFVIATGRLSTVRDVIRVSSQSLGFDPVFENSNENEVCIDKNSGRVLVKSSSKFYRSFDTAPMIGDASLITSQTNWKPLYSFEQTIKSMTEIDLERIKQNKIDV